MSVAFNRLREGLTILLAGVDTAEPSSPVATAAPSSPASPLAQPRTQLGGPVYDLQKELNKARILFPTTPADLVQKHRRITSIFHEFAALASKVVEERVLQLLLSGHLRSAESFRSLVGLPPCSAIDPASAAEAAAIGGLLPPELQGLRLLDLDSFTSSGMAFNLVTEPGAVLANSVNVDDKTSSDTPKDLANICSFERARKLAHREVKMRSHLLTMTHLESVLQLPLCAAVDFAGFTFFVEVELGLSSKTQVGGIATPQISQQFSRRVMKGDIVNTHRVAEHLSRAIGLVCHLRAHNGGGNQTYLPAEMQIHLGLDGVFYALCVRRLLPPVICGHGGEDPPETADRNQGTIFQSPVVRCLPQFLDRFCESTPLNPDAWSEDDARTIDSSDYEVLQLSNVLSKKAVAQLLDFLALLDTEMRKERERRCEEPSSPPPQRGSGPLDGSGGGKPRLAPLVAGIPVVTVSPGSEIGSPATADAAPSMHGVSSLSSFHHASKSAQAMGSLLQKQPSQANNSSSSPTHSLPDAVIAGLLEHYRGAGVLSTVTAAAPGTTTSSGADATAATGGGGLTPESVKAIFHQFGVNLKFLGQVLAALEKRLAAADDELQRNNKSSASLTARRQLGATSSTPSGNATARKGNTAAAMRYASVPFLAAHPVAKALRLELVARCGRIAFHHWQRREALSKLMLNVATVRAIVASAGIGTTSSSTMFSSAFASSAATAAASPDPTLLLERLMARCKRELEARTVSFLFRISGDCLSFQDGSDEKLWHEQLIPLAKLVFGYTLAFAREQTSTSTVSSFQGHELGLSTGSRMRLRPMATGGGGSDTAGGSASDPATNFLRVDFTPWGTVDDERYKLPTTSKFVTTHVTAGHAAAGAADSSSFGKPPSDFGEYTVHTDSPTGGVLLPGGGGALGGAKAAAPVDVRLGAKQDFRIVERLCRFTNIKLLLTATHDFSGVWVDVQPKVTRLATKVPLSPEVLSAVHGGTPQVFERRMLDEVKERRKLLPLGAPEAPIVALYFRLVVLYMMTAKPTQAVECCKKMRDALVRDVGYNELGVVITTLLEARCEMDRKRFADAVEHGLHALNLATQYANNSQVVASAMLVVLDAIDALGAPSFALRTKKADISTQLVPLCAKFGLAVGRGKAREALSRITADHATAEQLAGLGRAVKSVLKEQGLDAESSSMAVRYILLSESIRALPTAVKAIENCIPLTSTLFRPTMNSMLDHCYDLLSRRMAAIPADSVTLESLAKYLEVRSEKWSGPSNLILNIEQQSGKQLSDDERRHLNLLHSRSTYLEGSPLSDANESRVIFASVMYIFKFWLASILRSVPPEKRAAFASWDNQTMTWLADLVNASRAFALVHPIVSIQLNHMLLSLLNVELGLGDEIFGPKHATVPIGISWAYDLLCTAHRVVTTEIHRRGLAQARQRSAHVLELPASREDQLEHLTEIMVPVGLCLELLATVRNIYGFLSTTAIARHQQQQHAQQLAQQHALHHHSHHGPPGHDSSSSVAQAAAVAPAFLQLFAVERCVVADAADPSAGGGPDHPTQQHTRRHISTQTHMLPLVADVFSSCFCGFLPKGSSSELDDLLLSVKLLFTGELTNLISDVGRRYRLQKDALWNYFLTFYVALYDTECQIFTPIHNPKTPLRSDGQLVEMAKTLSLLTVLASTFIGAIQNQQLYEQMLASLTQRIPGAKRQQVSAAVAAALAHTTAAGQGSAAAGPATGAGAAAGGAAVAPGQDDSTVSKKLGSSKANTTTTTTTVGASSSAQALGGASPSSALHGTAGGGAGAVAASGARPHNTTINSSSMLFNISDVTPHNASTTSAKAPAFVERRGDVAAPAPSKLWQRMRSEDAAKAPFFAVSTTTAVAGSDITIQWQLPAMAPPRYGCIGIFVDDGRPLVQSEAYELRTGLQFRQAAGHVDQFKMPTRSGQYVLAYFCTGHSEGLPFDPSFVAHVRVVAGGEKAKPGTTSSAASSQQRTRGSSTTAALPAPEVVVLPPVGFSPCDTRKAQVARLNAAAAKDAAKRHAMGLPAASYDMSAALAPPDEARVEAEKQAYQKHIRTAQYANVAKGVQCIVLFSSTERKSPAF